MEDLSGPKGRHGALPPARVLPEGWLPEAGVAGHSPPPPALFIWWWWDVEPNPERPVKRRVITWHILMNIQQMGEYLLLFLS